MGRFDATMAAPTTLGGGPPAGRPALARFADDLRRIRQLSGSPSLSQLVSLTVRHDHPLARSTISDKLNAKSLVEWDFVVSFVTACRAYSQQHGAGLPDAVSDLAGWDRAHRAMLREIDAGKTEARLSAAAQRQLLLWHCGPASASAIRPAPLPRQLPAPVRTFTGRRRELTVVRNLAAEVAGAAPAPRVLAIDGMAGVGKTTVAVHAGHEVAACFPDGQLWVDLRGFGPSGAPMAPVEALGVLLDMLGTPGAELPAGLPARVARYRSLLADRRLLIVLDNARDCAQVRPLLPGRGGCLVLVTSRVRLTGLAASDGADMLTVQLPDPADARELMLRRLHATPEPVCRRVADEVVARCGRLPLALSIVAARAGHPTAGMSALAADLRADGLDGFDGGDPACDLRAVFSWSVEQLSVGARTLFTLLAAGPRQPVSTRTAARLAGLPLPTAQRLLAELAAANLVERPEPDRYHLHDLLRAYGVELGGLVGGALVHRAVPPRRRDFQLHSV